MNMRAICKIAVYTSTEQQKYLKAFETIYTSNAFIYGDLRSVLPMHVQSREEEKCVGTKKEDDDYETVEANRH